jgi:hypothetical protein
MKNQRGDILATVTFRTTKAGGRDGPTPPDELRCIMTIGGENLDVRLHLEETGSVAPGQSVRVPISFLFFEYGKEHSVVGTRFTLRDSRTIADGVIDEILFPQ